MTERCCQSSKTAASVAVFDEMICPVETVIVIDLDKTADTLSA